MITITPQSPHVYEHLAYRSKLLKTIKSARSGGAKGGAQEKWNKPCFPDDEHDGDYDDEDVGRHSGDNDVDIG